MKNLIKVKAVLRTAGIAALVAAIGFSMIACDNGTDGGGGRGPGRQQPTDPVLATATYVSYDGDGNTYELVITETVTGRAAIIRALDPNKSYTYTLTITFADNTVKISTGTVASVTDVTIVLQPTGSETTVTVTVSSTGNTNTIISFSADIPVDNSDEPVPRPAGTLTPTNPGGEPPEPPAFTGTPGLAYELINNGTAYSVSAGTATSGAVIIPASYNGKPVTEIGNDAFAEEDITSVTIPESVTSIGNWAFGVCTSLTSVTFAEGSQLTTIGEQAFFRTSITSVTIPESVTSIGNLAFSQCENLTSITGLPPI
jgi:hypothetical protein